MLFSSSPWATLHVSALLVAFFLTVKSAMSTSQHVDKEPKGPTLPNTSKITPTSSGATSWEHLLNPGQGKTSSGATSPEATPPETASTTLPSSGSPTSNTPTTLPLNSTTISSSTEPYSTRHPITGWNITATTIESVFPPERTQPGQPAACNNWHLVSPVDTCESIGQSGSWMTVEELKKWNPSLGDDCSGLYVGWWLCISEKVQNVTQSFTWITTDAPADVPTLTGPYIPTTFPPINDSFTASPTQKGVATGCKAFYQAQDGTTCRDIVDDHYVTKEDFFALNPALKGNCDGLLAGYFYCVVGPDGITALPPTVTSPPPELPAGQTDKCEHWYERHGESCDDLVAMFGTFSRDDFLAWNPSAGPDCSGLVDEKWYCVGIPGTPTTRTAPIPTTERPDTPKQSGIAENCSRLWLVGVDDSCESIETANDITEKQFLAWNPAVGESKCDSLVPDFYVCVAVDESSSVRSTANPTPTSTTKASSGGGTTSAN